MNKVNEYKFEQPVTPSSEKPQLIQAMSSEKGYFVAIKYFSPTILQKLQPEVIYRTFALFNSLRHKHLIHYHECLHIEGSVYLVMDWCEGKSLLDTLKGYKALPEKLVARYIYEVLQGLEYLHSQGNTHDNLRASNILTTNGQTKVTDFGLSAKISNLDVLNHPYWSAPEVLESKTFTKESDIWSLGCTIIELMTGKPPFADLPPEEARNHILTETPPLPTNASTHLCDFLRICFNRDPSQRPTAKELQTYFWITTNNVITKDEPEATSVPLSLGIQFAKQGEGKSVNQIEQNLAEIDKIFGDSESEMSLPKNTNNNPAPLQLKPAPFQPTLQIPANQNQLKKLPSGSSESGDIFDSSSSSASKSSQKGKKKGGAKLQPMNPAPLVQLNQPPLIKLPSKDEKKDEKKSEKKVNSPAPLLVLPAQAQKPAQGGPAPLLLLPGGGGDSSDFDIDDGSSDDESPLEISPTKGNQPILSLAGSSSKANTLTLPGAGGSLSIVGANLPSIGSLDLSSTTESSMSFEPSKMKKGQVDNKSLLDNFVETSDETSGMSLVLSEEGGQQATLIIQQNIVGQPNLDFLTESDESERRIFAHRSKVEDLSRELIAKLHSLNTIKKEIEVSQILDRISEILKDEPTVRSALVSQQGIMPIIEIIEFSHIKNPKVTKKVLSIIYDMCFEQSQIKENFCLLGGIPPLMKFLEHNEEAECRKFAVKILTEICSKSQDNTQMFIACNGVSAVKQILSYDLDKERELIVAAVETVSQIFGSQRATQKADLCRLFMKAGVFQPMAEILLHYSIEDEFKDNESTQKVVSTLCDLFNTFAQADTKVKMAMSSPNVMKNIIQSMYSDSSGVRRNLSLDDTLCLCKAIKFIAMDSETRENLTDAGVMMMTCEMLKIDFGKGETKDKNVLNLLIHSNLIMLLNDMCKLSQVSKGRIGIVADSRLLPHLVEFLKTESELKTMTLSVIMELYNVGKSDRKSMKKLIKDNLIGLYIENLQHPYWGSKAITAISTLLQDDSLGIEKIIAEEESIENFRQGIKLVDPDNAPSFIKGFISMARKSKKFVESLVNKEFCIILINKFNMKSDQTKSQVQTALLEFVLAMFQSNAKSVTLYMKSQEMKVVIQGFMSAIIVKQKTCAQQILDFFV
ncbi:STE family protein kinase [Tritrichomonas foetus]|uniref:STE family protein kinase n=1 Tax=Tritrichomonas foetus TaxID=1144522 RepID=A0A1J4KAY8_9EUKA|nr:STE family protein kinase [Tritrichomonas foetus]|eukprot:OHT06868.1 STE family protein kinase [Tritrichomonas foetus]